MKENRCIMCGNVRPGLEVREDYMINAIRWLKHNVTRTEKGYSLVVCKDCFARYDKLRRSYQKRQTLYVAIGVVFAVALTALSGPNTLGGIFYGLLILTFMYLLAQLSYMPALDMPSSAAKRRNSNA